MHSWILDYKWLQHQERKQLRITVICPQLTENETHSFNSVRDFKYEQSCLYPFTLYIPEYPVLIKRHHERLGFTQG